MSIDRLRQSIAKRPSIGVVGIASWDTVLSVATYPDPGGFAMIASRAELPGGTSANAAAAAAALGARVDLIGAVGDDETGKRLSSALERRGIDVSGVRIDPELPTDQTTVISSAEPPDRTILWQAGAMPRMGDRIDIARLFTRDLVILDSVDPELRRFLIDLPVHTYPDVKILVPMTYVVDFPGRDELESVLRSDALVGSAGELCQLMQAAKLEDAIGALRKQMRTSNLRVAAVTLGAGGAIAFDTERVLAMPALDVEVTDTTGAGDAFAGGLAVALACRLDLFDALAFANCVSGLSVRGFGAQASLPSLDEVTEALSRQGLLEPG